MKFISNLGRQSALDEEVNSAISFSNWISLLIVGASLGCTLLSYNLSAELVLISWLFTFINASCLLLNAGGYFFSSRYILSIAPSLYLAILQIAIKLPDQKMMVAVLLIQTGMLTVPWMMFRFHEKTGLILVNLVNVALILCSIYLPGQNTSGMDNSIYHLGIGTDFGLLISVFGTISITALARGMQQRTQKKNRQLLTQMEEKNQKMEKDREKMKEYIRQVEEAQAQEKKRRWISQSIQELGDIVRYQKDEQEIFDRIISRVVKSLGANQGSFYQVEEQEERKFIELKSCYAYDRKKFVAQSLKPGEGLIGQCYFEKEPIYLTDIPQGYTYITSGLGEATPTSLILIPLMFNDKVEGIMEVASFKLLEDYQHEYLEGVASLLGNFIYNERLLKKQFSIDVEMTSRRFPEPRMLSTKKDRKPVLA
ncbi:GAF domain-containing protein [Nafulsella turpanensis]|uniref:GAF domain-containing protein n=1 Tax=Nafulsella turpanensis TaxID=1265690 RepID=UPI000348E2FA|nr:GAF domain-containing protein [Nafulsella turpanensis]